MVYADGASIMDSFYFFVYVEAEIPEVKVILNKSRTSESMAQH